MNWGGIVGSAIAGGFAGAGAGLAQVGKDQTKLNEDQARMSWQEAKEMRLKELDQNYKIADEQRGEANAARRASDINTGADAILAQQRATAIPAKFGGQTPAEFDAPGGSLPNEQAMVAPTEADKMRAREQYAQSKGYTAEASAARQSLDTERRFKADENKNTHDMAMDERRQKYYEELLAHQKVMETNANSRAQQASEAAMRQATTEALKGAQALHKDKVNELKNLANDPSIDPKDMPAAKQALTATIGRLEQEMQNYRNGLAGKGYAMPPQYGGSGAPSAADFVKKPAGGAPAAGAAPPPPGPDTGDMVRAQLDANDFNSKTYAERVADKSKSIVGSAQDQNLTDLETRIKAALRAGRAAEANALQAQYNALKTSKYGG